MDRARFSLIRTVNRPRPKIAETVPVAQYVDWNHLADLQHSIRPCKYVHFGPVGGRLAFACENVQGPGPNRAAVPKTCNCNLE